jgi:hypothetical protein
MKGRKIEILFASTPLHCGDGAPRMRQESRSDAPSDTGSCSKSTIGALTSFQVGNLEFLQYRRPRQHCKNIE